MGTDNYYVYATVPRNYFTNKYYAYFYKKVYSADNNINATNNACFNSFCDYLCIQSKTTH